MSKMFNSTQKQWNNQNKQWLEKPVYKKIRPNSAQNIGGSDKYSRENEDENKNRDLNIQVKSLNELSDEGNDHSSPHPNVMSKQKRSCKHEYIAEIGSNKKSHLNYNDDTSGISRPLEPVYKNNDDYEMLSPDYKQESSLINSGIHKNKLSKSKEKKAKNLKDLAIPMINQRKVPLSRPFSGDPTKPK